MRAPHEQDCPDRRVGAEARSGGERAGATVARTGTALFQTTCAGRIVEWNRPAEELSGVAAAEAIGRSCWEVIRGRDAAGGLVCHPGCSVARLAREGWPVRCTDLRVDMPSGVDRLTVSTIVVGAGEDAIVLHPLHRGAPESDDIAPERRVPELTPRQRQILALLADGVRAKEIAVRLSVSVPTVRNHIHALLRRLGVTSQLAAVARAHELGLDDLPVAAVPQPR
jgi:DNA-binding CsgD family transcriptional regulator